MVTQLAQRYEHLAISVLSLQLPVLLVIEATLRESHVQRGRSHSETETPANLLPLAAHARRRVLQVEAALHLLERMRLIQRLVPGKGAVYNVHLVLDSEQLMDAVHARVVVRERRAGDTPHVARALGEVLEHALPLRVGQSNHFVALVIHDAAPREPEERGLGLRLAQDHLEGRDDHVVVHAAGLDLLPRVRAQRDRRLDRRDAQRRCELPDLVRPLATQVSRSDNEVLGLPRRPWAGQEERDQLGRLAHADLVRDDAATKRELDLGAGRAARKHDAPVGLHRQHPRERALLVLVQRQPHALGRRRARPIASHRREREYLTPVTRGTRRAVLLALVADSAVHPHRRSAPYELDSPPSSGSRKNRTSSGQAVARDDRAARHRRQHPPVVQDEHSWQI